MSRKINKNFLHLRNSMLDFDRGAILEGGSRSRKTWSGVDFVIYLCSRIETDCTINILRETYNSFKTTLYEDFNRRLPEFGIPSPFQNTKEVQSFFLFGNKINFLGCDKLSKFEGAGCDYFWANEAIEIPKGIFDQQEMRCRKFWWIDYNPKVTMHWIFDNLENRSDVSFCASTMLDNPFISDPERNKILSYEPTHPEDRKIKPKIRRPHPYNIDNGTADDVMWKVYGLGQRGAMKGRIFEHVTYIEPDQVPELDTYYHGLDFGFTNDPTALVKMYIQGTNLYFELLGYHPMETADVLHDYAEGRGIDIKIPTSADSADKYTSKDDSVEMVRDLKKLGWKVGKVRKDKTVKFYIGKMKECKIHIIKNDLYHHAKKEQENYKWMEINGILVNQPVDDFNHFWDAARYAYMAFFKQRKPITSKRK